MITFRTFSVGTTRGFGVGYTGTRELLQVSITSTEKAQLGLDIDIEYNCFLSVNIRIWKTSFNLKFLEKDKDDS